METLIANLTRGTHTMRRTSRLRPEWPAWRYGPDGESQMFNGPEEVPDGWTKTQPTLFEPIEPLPQICEVSASKKLEDLGVVVDPTWGNAKLQEMLKEMEE